MLIDEIKKQRDKVKGEGKKAFLSWLLDYYAVTAVVTVLVAAFVIWFVYSLITAKGLALGVVMLNAVSEETLESGLADDMSDRVALEFADSARIDLRKNKVLFDPMMTAPKDGIPVTEEDVGTMQAVIVKSAGGELDGFAADAALFGYYAMEDMFVDLRELITEERRRAYEEAGRLYYVDRAVIEERLAMSAEEAEAKDRLSEEEIEKTDDPDTFILPDPAAMQDPVPVGIVITDSPKITENKLYLDTAAVYGLPGTGMNPETALLFLSFLDGESYSYE